MVELSGLYNLDVYTTRGKYVIKTTINIVPSERDEIRPLQEEGSIEIPYERVQAVGDILLISPELVSETVTTVPTSQ